MTPMFPNRLAAPLSADEEIAERYADRTGWLMEIARETGNRTLRGISEAMKAEATHRAKDRRKGGGKTCP